MALSTVPTQHQRVLSGMRPTGRLHLGHYHGVLKNWVRLQHEYESYFFVADWHALTTHYEDPAIIAEVSRGLGAAMVGLETRDMAESELLQNRGW